MKEGLLAQTVNVREANAGIEYLKHRPKLEMVGLGLFYGAPGLGKSTWAQRTALKNGYIYLRLESIMTPKTFAVDLKRAILQRYGMGNYPIMGKAANIYKSCVGLLLEHPETVIFIDEIDYAFQQPKILGALRDLADQTTAIINLIGMQNSYEKLLGLDKYYFDRCNQFYEFLPASKKDLAILAGTIMDIEFGDDIISYIMNDCNGNIRQSIKLMHSLENVAKAKNLKRLTVQDLQ